MHWETVPVKDQHRGLKHCNPWKKLYWKDSVDYTLWFTGTKIFTLHSIWLADFLFCFPGMQQKKSCKHTHTQLWANISSEDCLSVLSRTQRKGAIRVELEEQVASSDTVPDLDRVCWEVWERKNCLEEDRLKTSGECDVQWRHEIKSCPYILATNYSGLHSHCSM